MSHIDQIIIHLHIVDIGIGAVIDVYYTETCTAVRISVGMHGGK